MSHVAPKAKEHGHMIWAQSRSHVSHAIHPSGRASRRTLWFRHIAEAVAGIMKLKRGQANARNWRNVPHVVANLAAKRLKSGSTSSCLLQLTSSLLQSRKWLFGMAGRGDGNQVGRPIQPMPCGRFKVVESQLRLHQGVLLVFSHGREGHSSSLFRLLRNHLYKYI